MRLFWVGAAGVVAGAAVGSAVGYKYAGQVQMTPPFLSVRLFEVISLAMTLSAGTAIAALYARRLSRRGKQVELVTESIKELGQQYTAFFLLLEEFMENPTKKTKMVTLQFKSLSGKLSTIEDRVKKCKLPDSALKTLRTAQNKLNEVITGDSWGQNLKKDHYIQDRKDQAKKEMQNIDNALFDVKYEILE